MESAAVSRGGISPDDDRRYVMLNRSLLGLSPPISTRKSIWDFIN